MSWKIEKLGDVCTIEKGAIGIQKAIPGEFPLVVTGEERKSHNEFQFDCEAVIVPLVSGTGHGHASIKRIHFQSGKFALGNILCAIIPKDKNELNAEYLYRYLDLNREAELVSRMKGMANVTLPIKEIAQIEIPIPSIDEQFIFVDNYKTLEGQSNELSTELTHQLTLVKKLRQQLLQDAVQGKLVEQNPTDEPASELLKKIKAEKEKLIAVKKLKKEKELPLIKPEEIPFEIPDNWVWCYFGDLSQLINGDRSKNYPNRHEYVYEGYPWINTGHIEPDGTLTKTEMYFITKEKFDSLRSGKIQSDDLVYCLRGATFGKTAFVTPYNRGAIASSLMIIRLSELIDKKFVYYYLKSDFAMQQLYRFNNGSAQPNLAANDVNRYFFPLPPLSEQNRIVQKLDELMQYCNELEANIKQSESQNEKLLQQVLREALR